MSKIKNKIRAAPDKNIRGQAPDNRIRGSTLALVMLLVAISSVIGVALLSMGMQQRIFAVRTGAEIEARCAADAAMTEAYFVMEQKLAAKALSGTNPSLPQVTDSALANCDATYSYKITASSIKAATNYQIEAVGKCGGAEKKVTATIGFGGPFEYAVFVKDNMVLKPGTTVDGYNYGTGPKTLQVGTNSINSDKIILGKGVTINGDVVVGVGGNPDAVIEAKDGATITGKTYATSEENQLPAVTVPTSLASMPSKGAITGAETITTSGKYDSISVGQGKIITINGPVTLYVTGAVNLSNSAELQIDTTNPQACLTLYLGGEFNTKNGGIINNLTMDAKKLKIYGLNTCSNINMATEGTFYGAIYAPNTGVNLKSAVEIYGSVVASQINQSSSANIHYDASLRDANKDDQAVQLVFKRWSE
ncbi:MAG: hypothetical protein MUO27_11075 [Sedimentisphaerales bacterium]|nr:hypothetical protein [Sedimentisphaerales bacterium]